MSKKEFKYTYSAPTEEERREIESIKNQYMFKDKNVDGRLKELRSLDSKVKNIPTTISLIIGIIGILVFGTGMTMILEWNLTLWGMIVCLIGILPVIFAYPVHIRLDSYLRQKYGDKIVTISNEILNGNKEENE